MRQHAPSRSTIDPEVAVREVMDRERRRRAAPAKAARVVQRSYEIVSLGCAVTAVIGVAQWATGAGTALLGTAFGIFVWSFLVTGITGVWLENRGERRSKVPLARVETAAAWDALRPGAGAAPWDRHATWASADDDGRVDILRLTRPAHETRLLVTTVASFDADQTQRASEAMFTARQAAAQDELDARAAYEAERIRADALARAERDRVAAEHATLLAAQRAASSQAAMRAEDQQEEATRRSTDAEGLARALRANAAS